LKNRILSLPCVSFNRWFIISLFPPIKCRHIMDLNWPSVSAKIRRIIWLYRIYYIQYQKMKPYTPRHNGKVERSHRKDNEYFYARYQFLFI
jgi:hypothetical protein